MSTFKVQGRTRVLLTDIIVRIRENMESIKRAPAEGHTKRRREICVDLRIDIVPRLICDKDLLERLIFYFNILSN